MTNPTNKNPAAALTAPGLLFIPREKEEDMNTVSPSTDTVHSIAAGDGFAHTVRLYTYEGFSHPEVVVAFGGQGAQGDLHNAREAREVAFALLTAANELDIIDGTLTVPEPILQGDGESRHYPEAVWDGAVGDRFWICPVDSDAGGPGIAVDTAGEDRTPDSIRQLMIELSMNLTILEALTS